MSEENKPRVGPGSPVGRRWFITGNPELTMTVKPQDIIVGDNGRERPQKAVRIAFTKEVKPRRLRGTGFLGTDNMDGTDRNDGPYWGCFTTDKQDIIDYLRGHEFYKGVRQDNKLERGLRLRIKELDFDPSKVEVRGEGVAIETRRQEAPVETPAPEDAPSPRPRARVGVTK